MSGYVTRIVEAELAVHLAHVGAVVLDGAKAVGKTATALRGAATVIDLDRSEQRQTLAADYDALAGLPRPVLLDEWQRLPEVWDVVRRLVDRGAVPGSFLLTGSSTVAQALVDSGAGRISRLRLRPMSLAERGLEAPVVAVSDLLAGLAGPVRGNTAVRVGDYVREIVGSGFPGIRSHDPEGRAIHLAGYVDNMVYREFPDNGILVQKPTALKAWLRAYALATASTASYKAIRDHVTAGEGGCPSRQTAIGYRDALAASWLTDPVPAWQPVPRGDLAALSKSSKHYLSDPGLAAHLLGLGVADLLRGSRLDPIGPQRGTILGRLFEALVAQSLQVYAQAAGANLWHLRTSTGHHAVDFIVERGESVLAIEVKLTATVADADARHLHWLRQRVPHLDVTPIIVTAGGDAYTRPDGVHVIPAVLLGP